MRSLDAMHPGERDAVVTAYRAALQWHNPRKADAIYEANPSVREVLAQVARAYAHTLNPDERANHEQINSLRVRRNPR